MTVRHIGLACRSRDSADRFYGRLLGLKKENSKTLPASICRSLFGIEEELTVASYAGDGLHFEVFIGLQDSRPVGPPAHVCLETGDFEAFLERCRAMDLPVVQVPKGSGWVTFIRDYDGNCFEIKES
jgi:catechol 2,3-dioxygenase-like lactoylglutathione lyase family enzyme